MAWEFLIASGNAHKVREFSELFNTRAIVVRPAPGKVEVRETGQSFTENAFLKAEGYYQKFETPVIADDSGLAVSALPEELGIYSARFGGEGLSDRERAELLLKKLEGKTGEERKAFFTCVLCFYIGPEEVFYFDGRMEGLIAYDYRGGHGFGYDPVFIPERHSSEESLAMLPEWKKKNSHRFQACQHAERFFSGFEKRRA